MRRCLSPFLWIGLRVCTPVCAQHWTAEQARELAAQVRSIDTDSVFTDCDWSALGADLEGKNIVLIGEPDHGSKEVADLRNSLIAELHATHGFDVVLFESGMGELILPDDADALEMANGLMGPWNTRSSVDLMGVLRAQRMGFAGFDVQRSGRSFAGVLREVCAELKVDSALYDDLEERYGPLAKLLGPKADPAAVAADATLLIANYDALHAAVGRSLPERPSARQLLVYRTLLNRADFLRYMLKFTTDKDWNARWAARDSAMAGNVRWLADVVYPGQKLIVVAHNYHIARSNPKEQVMGEWLGAHYGDRMLVIGTLTGGGTYADNSRRPVTMTPPDSSARDIKHLVAGLPGFVNYMTAASMHSSVSTWTREPLVVNDSFIDLSNSNTLVPAEHFDAVLFIRRVSPPVFLEP